MKLLISILTLFIFLIGSCKVSKAQITNTLSSGNWNNSGIWNNGVPTDAGASTVDHSVTLNQDIKIEGSCTTNSTLIDASGGSQYKIDVLNSGILTINANVTCEGETKFSSTSSGSINLCATFTTSNLTIENDATLYISSCSNLIINGVFIIKNNAAIICDGIITVNGSIDASNNAFIGGTGSITSSGNTTINNSASIFGSTASCGSTPCTYLAGGGSGTGVWQGTVNSTWENPLNWEDGIPSSGTDVTIDLNNYSGAMAHPDITTPSSFSPNKLTVQLGGQMTISNDLTITHDFNLDNNNSGTTTTRVNMNAGTLTINGDKKLKLKKGADFILTGGNIIITKELSVEEGSTFTINENSGTSSVLINSDGNTKGKLKIKGKDGNNAQLNLQAGSIAINAGDKVSLELDGNKQGATTSAILNISGGVLINNGNTQFKNTITDNTQIIVTGGTTTLVDNIEVKYKNGSPNGHLHIEVNGGTLKIQKELILSAADSLIQTGGTIMFEGTNNFPNDGTIYATGGTTIFQGNTTLTGGSSNWQFHSLVLNGTLNQAAINNINVSGNLTHNGVYTHNNQTITFNNNSNNQSIQSTSTLEFYNAIVNGTNTVTLASGNFNLRSTLTLTTGLFNANGLLTLLSDAIGTARIAEITGGSISGSITMQRYVSAGATTWRYLTSATSGATIADFNDNFFTTGFTGSNFPPSPAIPNPWVSIYTYDETTPGIIDSGFVAVSNVTNPIGIGQGIWAWLDGTQATTIDVVGPPNVGNINLPVSYTNNGTPSSDGWSMVGNPYPSTLDWDSPNITKTNINNAIYIWNPDLQQYASYVAGIGTNGGSRNIASSQGFWVQANSPGASIQVTEASKTATDGAFLRPASSIAPLKIKTENAYGADELVINFESLATGNFDAAYDAEKIASSNTYFPRTSSILNGLEYSINQINPQEISIPVKILAGVTGTHTIRIENAYNFNPSSCLVLEDLFTNTSYNLSLVDSFTTIIYDTTQTARFLLHIGAPIDLDKTDLSCFSNTDAKIVFTKNSTNTFDIIWKDNTNNIISSSTNIFGDSLTNLSSGTYYIETTDALCGNHIDTVMIIEPSQITAQFSSDVDTVYLSNGGMVNLTNQSTNATSFNWDFDDLNTSNVVSPNHQYTVVGDYFVTLNAIQSNDCFETHSKNITVLDVPTAISEIEANNNLKIWINNNALLIKGNKNVTIDVRNILGQLLFSATGNNQHSFDLSKLSSQVLIVNDNDNPSSIKVNFIKK